MPESSETPFIVKWCEGPGRRVISALIRSDTVDLNLEDVLQEVAIRWCRHAGRYGEKPEVERLAIANQIARNVVYERIRNSRHRVELPPSDVLTDPAPTDLEVACEIEDNSSKVRELLVEVGGEHAEVARLRFLEGLDAATIATMMGIAPHSVHTVLSRFYEKARAVIARRPELAPALAAFSFVLAPARASASQVNPTDATRPKSSMAESCRARIGKWSPQEDPRRQGESQSAEVPRNAWGEAMDTFHRYFAEQEPWLKGNVLALLNRALKTCNPDDWPWLHRCILLDRAAIVLALGTRAEARAALRECNEALRRRNPDAPPRLAELYQEYQRMYGETVDAAGG